MITPRDKRNIVLFGLIILLLFLGRILFCTWFSPDRIQIHKKEYSEQSRKIDSIASKIQPPPLNVSGETKTVIKFVEHTSIAERKKMLDGLRVIDSLKNVLKQSVKLQQYSAILDTIIHSTKDTVKAEYDFMKNTIHLNYKLAPREIKVARETITLKESNTWGLGFCVGYGAGITGDVVKPTPFIGIGIYKTIWN